MLIAPICCVSRHWVNRGQLLGFCVLPSSGRPGRIFMSYDATNLHVDLTLGEPEQDNCKVRVRTLFHCCISSSTPPPLFWIKTWCHSCDQCTPAAQFSVASSFSAPSPVVSSSLETFACLWRGVPFPLTLKPCFCWSRINRMRHAALVIPRDLDAVPWSTCREVLVSII